MNHKKLRKLCNFQYWLGSNYETLPTNSVEMTERATKYVKSKGEKLHIDIVSNSICQHCKGEPVYGMFGEKERCRLCGKKAK